MLPSKMRPTISASRLTTGEPELPPMMSFVVTKLNGVSRSSRPFASSQRCGSANGSLPGVALEGAADAW